MRTLEGFYYLVIFNKRDQSLLIASSLFNILPLCYVKLKGMVQIFSSLDMLSDAYSYSLNEEYLLERALFHYPVRDISILNHVHLTPANSYLHISGDDVKVVKHTFIEQFFVDEPVPYKKKMNHLVDLFLDTTKKYFPDDSFSISFTGGFDGRSLVSIAHLLQKPFTTFAFGAKDSPDVLIPQKQAAQLGLSFAPLFLEDEYIEKHSFHSGVELVHLSGGEAAFARAHYHYAVSRIAQKNAVMLTGNFGSELFRAMHNIGVMISKEFYDLVSGSSDDFIQKVYASPKLKLFHPDFIQRNLDPLLGKLLEKKATIDKRADKLNARFYIWVFEEVFRKYFGPEIVTQFFYLTNRSPFLSFPFVIELLKTKLAGVNSNFFEENPLRRFKGQLFYAHLLQKCWPELAQLETAKGYAPADLLTLGGKGRIFRSYLGRKKSAPRDPFGVKRAFVKNKEAYKAWPIATEIYNSDVLSRETDATGLHFPLDLVINILSTNYYLTTLR